MSEIYLKYKTELDAVNKYINNKYLYDIFHNYGFNFEGEFIEFNSNINIYEACFISQLINIYINTYKTDKTLRIVEIGLAYGTSALVIINEMIKYKYKAKYVVVDPNQTEQWKSIGMTNIKNFLQHMNSELNIRLIEKYSTVAMTKLKKKYDVSFIDGSHDEVIVMDDIKNSDRLLIKNGIMILDDVLHSGVRNAINRYFINNNNYCRISIKEGKFIREDNLYTKDIIKQSFDNPKTMYCFQKLN